MSDQRWILVLDIGSSSVRAWLYDAGAVGVDPGPSAQRTYEWGGAGAGAMEVDAAALFDHVAAVVDAATARARAADLRIAAVAVASFWHSLLGRTAEGVPCTPVLSWGDTRASGVARRLADEIDATDYHQRTGCFVHPSYPLVKLLWLREKRPQAFARAARWGSFPEYVEERLFGARRCSYSMGSGTGLMDVHRLRWAEPVLRRFELDASTLAPLVDAGEPLQGLRPEFAARWPELAEVPWLPALGDGVCANVGSGAVGPGRIGVTIGTSAAARAVHEVGSDFRVPAELWCYRLDARRVAVGGALSNGGNAIASLRATLRLPPEREWEARIAGMEPDSHGLTVLPFLVGERGPRWLQERRASVVGLTRDTSAVYLLRAWMEASAFRLAEVVRRIEDALGEPEQVHASGGALHASPVWARILADVLGRPVVLSVEREETSRGAALVAMEQLGWIDDLAALPPERAGLLRPDAGHHARYQAAMRRQHELERALRDWSAGSAPPPGGRSASEP